MAATAYIFTKDGQVEDFDGQTVPAIVFKASGCRAVNPNIDGQSKLNYTVDANRKTWLGNPYRYNEVVGGSAKNALRKAVLGVGLRLIDFHVSFCPDGVFAGDSFKDKQGRKVIELEWNGGSCSNLGETEQIPFDPTGHFDAFQTMGGEVWAVRNVAFNCFRSLKEWTSSVFFIEAQVAPIGRGNFSYNLVDGGTIGVRIDGPTMGIAPASIQVKGNVFRRCYSQPYLFKDQFGKSSKLMLSNRATFSEDNDFSGVQILKP